MIDCGIRPAGYEYDCICDDKLYHVGHKMGCQLHNLQRMRAQTAQEAEKAKLLSDPDAE